VPDLTASRARPAAPPHQPRPRGWVLLYRVGGISAELFALLLVGAIGLSVTTPSPPIAGGAATLD
jgi:hypothetical protein